jgi:hypothetical protein
MSSFIDFWQWAEIRFRAEMVKKKDKDPHAVALGRKGGKARIEKMTPERRSEIARKAVLARWAKYKKDQQKPD